ncbi:replication factor C subunit 1 [Coregonus clupeaformis]|uniref:replication factor C subunit 1 n=1 Tax=Coregonus clupeaformis TaxID=59861 RepID=UPI001E1C6DCB|nr:replication factor C subunit 1 [Coregonus clupeaformis]
MDIRRFFAPSKPAAQKPSQNETLNTEEESKKKKKKKSVSTDEEVKKKKIATKITSPKVEEKKKKKDGDKKRKKRAVIESDSEEEVVEQKPKAQKPDPPLPPAKKDPVQYVSETDSDSDNFLTLKKPAKPQENVVAKPGKTRTGTKERSPPKPNPALATGKGGVKKSPPVPVTPKSAPPQTKRTPTSVLDYFGSGSVQRSDKKLVASTKRKAPSQDHEESLTDEVIAQQLQMDEVMELERQVHEDEEFARTLAMLDNQPHAKKARKDSGEKRESATSPNKSSADSSHSSTKSQSQSNGRDHNQEVIGPSPRKVPPPVKTSSKLAMMKKREEEEGGGKRDLNSEAPISPKTESLTPSGTDRKSKPKTGSVTMMTTPTTLKTSPKKESTSPEDSERKRGNPSAFRSYLNRDGPRALGSKEIPTGAENCLEGCVFVISGVLECMERDEAKSLIERYGGKVTGNVSKRTTYLVMGRDGGAAKTEKAEGFGTKILDEDGLLELIRSKPGKKSKYLIAAEAENKVSKSRTPDTKTSPRTPKLSPKTPPKTPNPSKPGSASRRGVGVGDSVTPPGRSTGSGVKRGLGLGGKSESASSSAAPSVPSFAGEDFSLLWVDKYRPRNLKAVIGQQGDQSPANKLLRWLKNWHTHHAVGGAKPAGRGFGKFASAKDDGSSFKAALLSGPPGVGKTTTAALVCEELAYSYVEMNASCTRSKNSLKEVIAESLDNTSINYFYTGSSQTVSSKHVLIMDEIDGMAGNEDRGGIQEMIGLIKQSKIPIICMCNDRNHQKIRSLANYCFDLRFQRPRLEQIKGAMMSIAFKEGLKIPPPALNEMILASNQDIRQVLHNLRMWSAKDKVMTYDRVKEDANNARKDMKLGPFDVCRKVFSKAEESSHMTLIDKSDLFFHDYSLAPLFIQENYIHVKPAAAGGDLKSHLVLLSKTADSICDGDLVDRQIRSKQAWSLLPTQAIYSSVLPGELMRGFMNSFPSFPSWLGKFSSCNKHSRIIQELASHMSLRTLSSRQAVSLDYLPYLRMALLCPLQRQGAEGAGQAVQLLDDYHLVREDVDSLMEISLWGGQPDPYAKLDPKVKSAFTRAYNRETHLTPYSLQPIKKGRRGGGAEAELGGEGREEQAEEEEEEGVAADAMIKQKKAKPSKEPKKEKATAGDSGKGKGKGKGKARK